MTDEQGMAVIPVRGALCGRAVTAGRFASASTSKPSTRRHDCVGEAFYWPYPCRRATNVLANLPYRLSETDSGVRVFQTAAGDVNAVQVSADILRAGESTRRETTLQGELTGVVITVPAYFDDAPTPKYQRCSARLRWV